MIWPGRLPWSGRGTGVGRRGAPAEKSAVRQKPAAAPAENRLRGKNRLERPARRRRRRGRFFAARPIFRRRSVPANGRPAPDCPRGGPLGPSSQYWDASNLVLG